MFLENNKNRLIHFTELDEMKKLVKSGKVRDLSDAARIGTHPLSAATSANQIFTGCLFILLTVPLVSFSRQSLMPHLPSSGRRPLLKDNCPYCTLCYSEPNICSSDKCAEHL